jgi:hypothetical protein
MPLLGTGGIVSALQHANAREMVKLHVMPVEVLYI